MTSQGSAFGRFQRAVARGNLVAAELAAREPGRLSLGDALALVLLYAEQAPERFPRAAARWHDRFSAETGGVTLAEAGMVLAGLQAFGTSAPEGLGVVLGVCRRHRIANLALAERIAGHDTGRPGAASQG